MKRWAGIALVVGLLVSPGTASAVRLVTPEGNVAQPYQRWTKGLKVPTPARTVIVYTGQTAADYCGVSADFHTHACAQYDGKGIGVVDPIDRNLFLHELGHVFDFTYFHRYGRGAAMHIMGFAPPWFSETDLTNSPGETFADAYVWCATFGRMVTMTDDWHAYGLTSRSQWRLCKFIRRASGLPAVREDARSCRASSRSGPRPPACRGRS